MWTYHALLYYIFILYYYLLYALYIIIIFYYIIILYYYLLYALHTEVTTLGHWTCSFMYHFNFFFGAYSTATVLALRNISHTFPCLALSGPHLPLSEVKHVRVPCPIIVIIIRESLTTLCFCSACENCLHDCRIIRTKSDLQT